MQIQKLPVSPWYTQIQELKDLLAPELALLEGNAFRPVFYDIETTGLSRNASFVYLIGAVVFEDGTWNLYQWFAQKKEEEVLLLKEFSRFLTSYTCTIQYNGCQFDQPFLEERFRLYQIPSPFTEMKAFDLYRILKPLKNLLKLSNMKQPELEAFLDLPGRNAADGKECIRLYRLYLKSHLETHAREALLHNQEDLQGLGKIVSLTAYLQLMRGFYQPMDACYDGEHLLFTLQLAHSLPTAFSNGTTSFDITGESTRVRLAIKSLHGQVKHYYPNYKDYEYIPSEDTAMPKSLSACLDKSLRRPAKPETCYTWFECTKAFLQNPNQQLQYLTHSLPYLLATLS